MTIGERLREIRNTQPTKPSQEKFAKSLGLTRVAYSSYELDRVVPAASTQKLICTLYNINPRWLETGEGAMRILKDDDLSQAIRTVMRGQSDFAITVMTSLAAMPDEFWNKWHDLFEEEKSMHKK